MLCILTYFFLYVYSCAQLGEIMRLNLNSTEESDIKDECIDGVKVIYNSFKSLEHQDDRV